MESLKHLYITDLSFVVLERRCYGCIIRAQDKCYSSIMNAVKQYFLIVFHMFIEFRNHFYWCIWVYVFPLVSPILLSNTFCT